MCVRAGAAVENQEFESRHWCIFCLYSALWYQVVFLSCRTPPLLLWFHYIPVELCSNDDPSVAWHVQLWNVYLCLCNKHNARVNVLQSGGAKLWKPLHLLRNDSTFIFCMNELWPCVGKAFRVWENLWPQWTLHFDSNWRSVEGFLSWFSALAWQKRPYSISLFYW